MPINNATNNAPFVWTSVSADQQLIPNYAIINLKPTLLNLTLPTTAKFGTTIIVQGLGAGGWIITPGTGQQIIVGNQQTTVTTGSLASTMPSDSVSLVCTVADTIWSRFSQAGNLAIDGSSIIQTPYDALKNMFMWQHQKSADNITGDMSEYRMTYPDLVFDVGGNWDGDSVFIAPEAGIYFIRTYISVGNGHPSVGLVEGSETDIVTAIAGYMVHSI